MVEGYMLLNFTSDESLKNMDTAIKEHLKDIEYWGDLDLSKDSLEILKNRTIILLERGIVFKNLFKQYPYAMVSYVVFLVKYKYKSDFWGMISEEIGIAKPNALDQTEIGKLILKVFDSCGFDYSVTKDSNRKYVDSILYEVGMPPESNFGDLFYIFKYGLMSNVDPQILINEIISKTYGVHKPLLHFFDKVPEERVINFVLDIQDTYIAATQMGDFSNKYSDAYLEWLELDKAKSASRGKNSEDLVEVKPYFYFDDGKRGLCIVLPRQNMTEEWVESATWSVTGDDGFCVEKECYVQGAEKKRFIDQIIVPVKVCTMYTLKFEYNDGFEFRSLLYELKGLEKDEFFYFDSNGRKINQRYIKSPYGIVIYSENYEISCNGVDRNSQSYPLLGNGYKIEQITPLTTEAQFVMHTSGEDIALQMKPQVIVSLSGKKLFDTENVESEMPLFLETPNFHLQFEGHNNTEGIELRVGRTSIPLKNLSLDKDNIIDIGICFDEKAYGIHSIRLYQFNRFIKQIRFCLLPDFKSNYDSNLYWVRNRADLKSGFAKLIINKVDGWQIDFTNGNVQNLPNKYEVLIPYREGVLKGNIVSQQDDLHLTVGFELPICSYKYDVISGNEICERCDMQDFLKGNPWLSLSFYGNYRKNIYTAELVSANGVEQKKEIKLSNNGSANVDLNIFRDTLQEVPLPVKIRVVNIDNEDSFDVILVDEVVKFRYRPQYYRKARCIAFMEEDIKQNAILKKYGDDFELELNFDKSYVNKKGVRTFPIPDDITITSGYYRVIRENSSDELFATNDDFEVTLQTDQFFVTLRNPKNPIVSFSEWIEQFICDLIRFRSIKKIDELRMSESYLYRKNIAQFEDCRLSDNDISNLVLLGTIHECKISNAHKDIISEIMLMISKFILTNEDRFRIIERLVCNKTSDIEFAICKKNYCLLLFEIPVDKTDNRIKELAAALKPISITFSLQLLLREDAPIRETFGNATYRDAIGQDTIVEMMTTNTSKEETMIARKHFLLEDGTNCVHIALNSSISGINNLFDMADERKLRTGKVYLDKKKIPDVGTYFAGTRYTDLFVNWYIRNHMGDVNNNSALRTEMKLLFDSFKSKVWNQLMKVNRNENVKFFFKEFNDVLMERSVNRNDESNYTELQFAFPSFFYFEGIAALIVQLDEFDEFPELKKEASKFMVESFQIAPFMAERDTLMAMVYIYLRRKEKR